MIQVRVGDIERAVARDFPVEWAEEWDRVGLLAGDPDAEVTGVVLALDPTRAAIASAASLGANVVVTHHPAFLKMPEWLTPGRGSAGVLFSALSSGIALLNAHTNLDRAPSAGRLLPAALGLEPIRPIERALMPLALVTVFVRTSMRAASPKPWRARGQAGSGSTIGAGSSRPREPAALLRWRAPLPA